MQQRTARERGMTLPSSPNHANFVCKRHCTETSFLPAPTASWHTPARVREGAAAQQSSSVSQQRTSDLTTTPSAWFAPAPPTAALLGKASYNQKAPPRVRDNSVSKSTASPPDSSLTGDLRFTDLELQAVRSISYPLG